MKLGVLIGSVLPGPVGRKIGTIDDGKDGGSVPLFYLEEKGLELIIVPRHSMPPRIPPHMVDHRANLRYLFDSGAEAVISICSTGALSPSIDVPSIAIPDDYIDLFSGATIHDDVIEHSTPGFDPDIRNIVLEASMRAGVPVRDGGTYVQTMGPRLETRAEVRLISGWGDYVGMNLGPEATLSCELGLPHAGLVTVDNYAHGIKSQELDFREILSGAKTNWDTIRSILINIDPN